MCNFLSAIVTRQKKLLVNPLLDHHTDLIEYYQLKDNHTGVAANFVRVEFTPKDKAFHDADAYELTLDEREAPAWWDDALAFDVAEQLRELIASMIVNDERTMLVGGAWIIGPTGKVKRIVGPARIVTMTGESKVDRMEKTNVGEMRESSNVGVMWGSSNVGVMRESSNVKNDQRTPKEKSTS